jgi:hypothetical protein
MVPSAGGAYLPYQQPSFTNGVNSTGGTFTTPAIVSPTLSGTFTATGTAAMAYTSGSASIQQTLTASAYGVSAHEDELFSKITLTPTSTVTAANGLNAIRGEVNITAAKTLGSGSASYVTGVYGRVNFNSATVNIGSGDLAAVYGKFDLGTSTLTSGHIAPVQSNIVNPPASAATTGAVALFYGESASGTKINCGAEYYMAANFAFVMTDVNTSNYLPAISNTTLNGLNIKVQLNGTTYYIPTKTAA